VFGTHIGVVTPELGCVPSSVSALGGLDTWVQQLYTTPRSVADKRQTHGNVDSMRRWVVLEHWLGVVDGVWHSHRVFGTHIGLGRWFETWVALI